MAFQRMEPLGMDRMDYYFGLVAASAINAMRSSKSKTLTYKDMIVWLQRPVDVDDQLRSLVM